MIPAHANLPNYTAVERLIQQTTVVRQYLGQELGKVTCAYHIFKIYFMENFVSVCGCWWIIECFGCYNYYAQWYWDQMVSWASEF